MNNSIDLGLKNVKIIGFSKTNNGHLEIIVEKTTISGICPTCNMPSSSIKDHHIHPIITKPIDSIPIQIYVKKKRFRCYHCRKTFTEEIEGLPKNHIYTKSFEDNLEVLHKHMDYPTIQRHLLDKYQLYIPSSTIWKKLKDKPTQSSTLPLDIQKAKYVGLDEFSYAKGRSYGVLVVNIDKRKIADMVAGGKDQKTAEVALSIFDPTVVEACCIDFSEAFKNAVHTKFPHAMIVVDKFHVIKLLNEAIKDIINKRIIPDLENSQKKYLKQHMWFLLKGKEKLTKLQIAELPNLFSFSEELKKVYDFKEQLRDLYTIKNFNIVYLEFHKWLRIAKSSHIPELIQVAETYSNWSTYILNYWRCPISNAITEGKINKIKVLRRKAYHYRNFWSLRYQVLKSEQYNFKK